MGYLFDRVKDLFKDDLGCHAVVDEDSGEICGDEIHGTYILDSGQEIKYCFRHHPNNSKYVLSRGPMKFYDPESGEFVEMG